MTEPELLDIEELKPMRFEFDNQLGGVPIASVQPVAVDVQLGTHATPAAVLVGDPVIDVVNEEVVQRVQGVVEDVTYRLRCRVTDATGLKHTCVGLITVKRF